MKLVPIINPDHHEPFSLGSVVVPALDGILKDLGYEVKSLGSRGLGLVFEKRGSKALILFPELKLNLWLGLDELADLFQKAQFDQAFKRLLPESFEHPESRVPAVFWPRKLGQILPIVKILGLEIGVLNEIWDSQAGILSDYYHGETAVAVAVLSLGISEFKLDDWHRVENLLGSRLLFARFLPAGLSKIEVLLYLNNPPMAPVKNQTPKATRFKV